MTSSQIIENTPLFKNSQGVLQFIAQDCIFSDPSFVTVYLLLSLLHTISASESYTVHQPSILKLPATSGLQKPYWIQHCASHMPDCEYPALTESAGLSVVGNVARSYANSP